MISGDNAAASVISIASGTTSLPVSLDQAIPSPQQMSNGACSFFSSTAGTVLFLTGAAAVGVGCTGYMLGKYACNKIRDYHEQKFIDEIEKIKELCRNHFKPINVGTHTFDFPPIFETEDEKTDKKRKRTRVDAIHLPKKILQEKGKTIPFDSNRYLGPYHESICDAIKHLKKYISVLLINPDEIPKDFLRQPNGIAIAIVLFCVEMLDSHCQKFEGYEADEHILDCLCEFLINYSNLNQTGTNSRRYSFLKDAYKEMNKARTYLKAHREVRSLHEVVNELRVHCHMMANESIINFAKLTNHFDHHEDIEETTKTLLQDGIISNFHITKRNIGYNQTADELGLLDSPCRETTMQLAAFAKRVIDPKVTITEDEIHPVKINIPSYEDYTEYARIKIALKEKNNTLTDDEKLKYKKTETQLKDLEKMFDICYNFVTRVAYEEKNKKTDFVNITDYELLVKRAKFITDYADLIQKIIWCQYYSNKILDGIESLGEIYIINDSTLGVLEEADKRLAKIMEVVNAMENNFKLIVASNNDTMPIPDLNNLNVKIESDIKGIKKIFKKARKKINSYAENRKNLKVEFLKAKGDILQATKVTAMGMGDVYTPPVQPKRSNNDEMRSEDEPVDEFLEMMLGNKQKKDKKEKKKISSFIRKKIGSRNSSQEESLNEKKKKKDRGSRHTSTSPVQSRGASRVASREDYYDSDYTTLFKHNSQQTTYSEDKSIVESPKPNLSINISNPFSLSMEDEKLSLMVKPPEEAEVIDDQQVNEMTRTIDYLNRLKKTRLQLLRVNKKIEGSLETGKKSRDILKKLYISLDRENVHIKKMIDDIDEKTDIHRHEKIDKMLSIFDEIINNIYNFTTKADIQDLKNVNEIIQLPENATYIDRYLNWWSIFSTTETRTIMDEIKSNCEELKDSIMRNSPVIEI